MTYVVFDIYPHITVSLTNIVEYYENSNTNARTQVQNAIDNMVAKGSTRTIFVIAHRLSTIRNADMIVVLGSAEEHLPYVTVRLFWRLELMMSS